MPPVNKKKAKKRQAFQWIALILVLVAAGFCMVEPTTRAVYKKLYPRGFQEYVEQYSREYRVDQNLIYAVAKTESNFNPQAHSNADARGVMQMTKDAFEWVQYRMGDESNVTYADIFDPEVSIQYGTYMLKLLLEEMGTEQLAVCSYHAGMSNVNSWLEKQDYSKDGVVIDKIPYSDTEWYHDKVFETKEIYKRLYT